MGCADWLALSVTWQGSVEKFANFFECFRFGTGAEADAELAHSGGAWQSEVDGERVTGNGCERAAEADDGECGTDGGERETVFVARVRWVARTGIGPNSDLALLAQRGCSMELLLLEAAIVTHTPSTGQHIDTLRQSVCVLAGGRCVSDDRACGRQNDCR